MPSYNYLAGVNPAATVDLDISGGGKPRRYIFCEGSLARINPVACMRVSSLEGEN